MDKHKNYTATQLKAKIDIEIDNLNENENISLYRLIWEKEKTLNNAVKLVRSLRKAKRFNETEKFHDKFKELYPDSSQLESERLWFTFSSKVCDKSNSDYDKDAESILKLCSQEDRLTKLIFEVTSLFTVSRLVRDEKFNKAYKILSILNPNLLDIESRGKYKSNKKMFYFLKASVLAGMDNVNYYINWAYSFLNFTKEKKDKFIDEIISRITLKKEWANNKNKGYDLPRFMTLLYDIDKEITTKKSNFKPVIKKRNSILISELGEYLFCPASYAINKSYNIPKPVSINPAKWFGKKEGFLDKHTQYKTDKNVDDCFKNFDNISSSGLSLVMKKELKKIFESKIITDNTKINNVVSFKSDDGILVGAPDFILESSSGQKILILEKFSSLNISGNEKVYDADTIKIEAYLTKFKTLNISLGYFINWFWKVDRTENNLANERVIKMVDFSLKKISLDESREVYVDNTIGKINSLLDNVHLPASNLGFVNKCLSCSVNVFCCHKTGELEHLKLPYEIRPLNL